MLIRQDSVNPWLVCISAALFFFYQFLQLSSINSISGILIQDFNLTYIQLGELSGAYLYGLAIALFPAGLLLDRFSNRKILLVSMMTGIIATILFSQVSQFHLALLLRFIMGMMHAIAFLGACRLAAQWLQHKMAFAIGMVVSIGLLGGIAAQAPLTILVNIFGWRSSFISMAAIGSIILLCMFIFIQDAPISSSFEKEKLKFSSFKKVFNIQNFLCAIYTALLNLPIIILGALWGSLYLENAYDLNALQASTAISMIFIGTIIGSPIVGIISDKWKSRKILMVLGAFLSFIICLAIAFSPLLSFWQIIILFFGLGLFTSTQVISYSVLNESNPNYLSATAIGFASIIIMGSGGIFQPMFGWLSEHSWQTGFLMIPICIAIAIILVFFLQETAKSKII